MRRLNRTTLKNFEGLSFEHGSYNYIVKLEEMKTKLIDAD